MAFGLAAVGRRRVRELRPAWRGWRRLSRSASRSGTILTEPIFIHFGWALLDLLFVAESMSLILAGLVIARWFLRRSRAACRRGAGRGARRARAG